MIRRILTQIKLHYSTAGIITLNTLLFLAVVNVALAVWYLVKDSRSQAPPAWAKTPQQIEVAADFEDYRLQALVYQPWVHYSNQTNSSRHLNVDLDQTGVPIRRTHNPGNDLPKVRIFTFGGSTTFGNRTADGDTWPSVLSRALNARLEKDAANHRVEVSNYGNFGMGPSCETALFIDLLRRGHRPHVAIFMDGVNHGVADDSGPVSKILRTRLREASAPSLFGPQSGKYLPMLRLVRDLKKNTPAQSEPPETNVDHVVNRFDSHRRITTAVGKLHGVQVLHVSQPNGWLYLGTPLSPLASRSGHDLKRADSQQICQRMKESGWVDLSELPDEFGKGSDWTIDGIYYTREFAEFLVERLLPLIELDKFRPSAVGFDSAAATGVPLPLPLVPLN